MDALSRTLRTLACTLLLALSVHAGAAAQPAPAPTTPLMVTPVPRDQFAPLWFSNRLIVMFRAAVVLRQPIDRADGAKLALSRLVEDNVTGPVEARTIQGASVISVGGRDVFGILPADLAEGENLPELTTQTVALLQTALTEAVEARTPGRLSWAAARSLLVTALMAVILVALVRMSRWATGRLMSATESILERSRVGADPAVLRATRLREVMSGVVRLIARGVGLFVVYVWLGYILKQFPLTRPWGEHLGNFLGTTLTRLGLAMVAALPGLFTAALIFLAARFVVRLAGIVFHGIEDGRIDVPALSGAKAAPTRRIVTTLVWLFAAVVAYPYLPGSNTDAFKGVSVFIGLVVSIGSSGIVNQMMSGFMLTYSGALAAGDYATVGDFEGTVTRIGALSTKVRTRRNEEVTIPNAVVISGVTVNYSRNASEGVYAHTTVTIGYDVPWRQVEAMLLEGVARAPGVRRDPAPIVLKTNLADFYIEYTLLVCVQEAAQRGPVMSAVRAYVADVFNEHGVQIMSPHYESDPAEAKIVARAQWHTPPAAPEQS